MSKAEEVAMQHCCAKCVHDKFGCSMKVLHNGRDCIKCGNYIKGYQQAQKDVAEAFARIIRGNLSMIDEKVQVKFEQLYTDITGEKMYKGFND